MVEKINITVCGDGGCGKSTSDMFILARIRCAIILNYYPFNLRHVQGVIHICLLTLFCSNRKIINNSASCKITMDT